VLGDLVVGRIFHVPAASLQLGSQATVHELTLRYNGQTATLFDLVGTSPWTAASTSVSVRTRAARCTC
jgi:hypothetical protein